VPYDEGDSALLGGVGLSVPQSVKQRLYNLARQRGEDFNRLLVRYALERFLCRLSVSPHRDKFVLKGAMLFTLWLPDVAMHRATKDLDLLGYCNPDPHSVVALFEEIIRTEVEDDGLVFEQIRQEPIRPDEEYGGLRLVMKALLGTAQISVQIDVGFGDVVFPTPSDAVLPTLLKQGSPTIRVYARETAISEKFHALAKMEMENSRLKDYFDLQFLAEHFAYDGELLVEAMRSTFSRRDLPVESLLPIPPGLDTAFSGDPDKQRQWAAFLSRSGLSGLPLPETVSQVKAFLLPVLDRLRGGPAIGSWTPGGPWSG
jgi:predicted nucleotidyltransferase component of viral defense system